MKARVGSVSLPLRVLRSRRGYREQSLLRSDLQSAVGRYGYTITREAIPPEGLKRLAQLHGEFSEQQGEIDDERFTPLRLRAGPNAGSPRTKAIVAEIEALVRPVLASLTASSARAAATVFQHKPSSPSSGVDPHQDAILVDERTDIGVYTWIPLVDIDERNGALYMVPGSHRFGLWPRLPATGSELQHLRGAIARTARVLRVPAGCVVLFDHATWHGSLPNRSGRPRVALGGVVRPGDRPGYTAGTFDGTPPSQLELFRHPVGTGLSDSEFWSGREHVGRCDGATLTAGPRSLAVAARIERTLRPNAPGSLLEADSQRVDRGHG